MTMEKNWKIGGLPPHFRRTPRGVTCKKNAFFQKSVKTAVPDAGNTPGASVLTKLIGWHRVEVGHEKCDFCDLQKSRHLQKSRVTERHNRGTKRKLKSHPRPQNGRPGRWEPPRSSSFRETKRMVSV